MKKIFILAIAVFAAFAATAQVKTTDYDNFSFKGISIDDDFVVTLSTGPEYRVSVQAESPYMQYIKVGVSAGVLEISLDDRAVPSEVKKLYKGAKPVFSATVVTPEPLKSYKLEGKSVLTISGEISLDDAVSIKIGDNAELKPATIVSRSCSIELDKKAVADVTFNGDKITVAASGSASLNLTRESSESDIALSGSSNLVMRGKSETMKISAKGTSKAALNGETKEVEYSLGGTSNINAIGLATKNAAVTMSGLCTLTEAASNKLKINISSGANLVFDGKPEIEVESIKNSSVTHYSN